ncbi:MAG: sigma-70 family RNA polymerase sigma factor [Bryobacterales bacterium]|nr:sigma-70 family RNA polymerase sigma factor [Bryobacterales bacterium]MDE0261138.1 sigma-70 family RNA polymerase sigma factor [Bryobacterales bacterium]
MALTTQQFEAAFMEHRSRVFNLCRYLLRSADRAEDATHEVFLRGQRGLSTYDPSKPLWNWLARITSHYCIDQLRRRTLESRLFDPSPADDSVVESQTLSPLDRFLKAERGETVRAALMALPERYRVPLVLAYYCELSYAEIGTLTGNGRNTVGTMLFRGKQLLRQRLTGEVSSGLPD